MIKVLLMNDIVSTCILLNSIILQLISHIYRKNTSDFQPMDWLDMNCCLPRQNCGDRKGVSAIFSSELSLPVFASLISIISFILFL